MKVLREVVTTNENSLRQLGVLLDSTFVIENEVQIDIDKDFFDSSAGHRKLIDQCIVFLLQKRLLNNVLVAGYKLAKNNTVRSILHCENSNSAVKTLKSSSWELLHTNIGSPKFVNLILNHSIFTFNGEFTQQVAGNSLNKPHLPPSWIIDNDYEQETDINCFSINNRPYLYHNTRGFCIKSIILDRDMLNETLDIQVKYLMREIFENDIKLNKKALRTTVIETVLKQVLENQQRIPIIPILDKICPKTYSNYHLDRATPVKCVNKFIVVILEKLKILQLIGSRKNSFVLFSKISQLLKLPLNGKINVKEFFTKLNVNAVRRYLSIDPIGQQKQSMRLYLTCFVNYLHTKLIPSLLKSFFYCTEVSSYSKILYFRNDEWNSISTPFLKEYLDKYLVQNTHCNSHFSYMESQFNHCNFRLIPKKGNNEFRVIGIPYKGNNAEELLQYKQNHTKVIVPTKLILDYLRKSRQTTQKLLFSAMQISDHICQYKCHLHSKYGYMPKLFYLKFDIHNCYDSIPIAKAKSVLNSLINNCGYEEFYVRSVTILNTKNNEVRYDTIVNGHINIRDFEIMVDNSTTTFLTKEDIMDLIEFEMEMTSIRLFDKCYLRKDGLFQGLSLSATIVDILYDDMLEKNRVFKDILNNDGLVLRHADDFLLISPSKEIISYARLKINEGFTEYNAQVNHRKIVFSESDNIANTAIPFCGVEIIPRTLEVIKRFSAMNETDISDHEGNIYSKCAVLFKMRLNYGTMNANLNSISTMLKQVENATINIVRIILNSNHIATSVSSFSSFVNELYNICLLSSRNLNLLNHRDLQRFLTSIKKTILTVLLKNLKRKYSIYNGISRNMNSKRTSK